MTTAAEPGSAYQRLARPDGTFSMIAIDQRDTLRRLLREAGHPDNDDAVRQFKAAVMESLAGTASAVLTDPEFGLPAAHQAGLPGSGTGLILSADVLQANGAGQLVDSAIDKAVMDGTSLLDGVDALKFLVLWPAADDRKRLDQVLSRIGEFVQRCTELGILSIVETLMAETDRRLEVAEFNERLVTAARECAGYAPGLYKTPVPRQADGPEQIRAVSAQITAAMPCPWVVLSAGVPAAEFPAAVRASCQGGASGFLCGQAVWGPSIKTSEPLADLRTAAVDRLALLAAVAAETARPWPGAIGPRQQARTP